MGHYSAAVTLAEEIRAARPDARVKIFDIYQGAFPGCCRMIYQVYSSLVERGVLLYNLAYKNALKPKAVRPGPALPAWHPIHGRMQKALTKELESFAPDAVIATYSLCAKLMSEYKRQSRCRLPLVTCITDVTTHNVWVNEETDLYLVAAESTRAELLSRGVPAEKIAVSGIPVRPSFRRHKKDRASCIPPGQRQRELLIMGGGLGLLPEKAEFYDRLNRLPGVHTTVITGSNEKLRERLADRYANITVLGCSQEVDRLMAAADLLITKPGGVTMFEAIQAELPLLLFRPFLEQEVKNGRFVGEKGLGMVLDKKPEAALGEIACLLDNPYLLRVIQKNMRRLKESLDEGALLRFLAGCTENRERVA